MPPSLMVKAPVGVVVKKGATVDVKLTATLNDGFHLNSHTPTEDYLIPLSLKWEGSARSGRCGLSKAADGKIQFRRQASLRADWPVPAGD